MPYTKIKRFKINNKKYIIMGKIDLKLGSISSKVFMAIAGLFLMSFLMVHLFINLLMLLSDGGVLFGKAVHFMTYNPAIKIFEYVLFAGFVIHMIIGVIIFIRNYLVRPIKYAVSPRSKTSFFSKYMIHTGVVIFGFLILHFMHFFFIKIGWVSVPEYASGKHDFYTMAMHLFSIPLYSIIYIICFLLLGFHLNHALQSAFQTLGLNHPKYTPFVKVVSGLYAIIMTLGFTSIPVYIYFFS